MYQACITGVPGMGYVRDPFVTPLGLLLVGAYLGGSCFASLAGFGGFTRFTRLARFTGFTRFTRFGGFGFDLDLRQVVKLGWLGNSDSIYTGFN